MTIEATLLTTGPTLPRWQAGALAHAAAKGGLRITRHFEVEEAFQVAPLESLAQRLHCRAEGLGAERVAVGELYPGVARTRVRRGEPIPALEPAPDVWIDTRTTSDPKSQTGPTPGALAWRFAGAPGDVGLYRALVGGFARFDVEVVLSDGRGTEKILAHGYLSPPDRDSLRATWRAAEHAAGQVLAKAVGRLRESRAIPSQPEAPPGRRGLEPGSLVAYAWRRGSRALRGRWLASRGAQQWLEYQNWFLAYRTDPALFVRNRPAFGAEGLRLLLPPEDRCWADPCVVTMDGREHVFFEDWSPAKRHGTIGWMALGDRGEFGEPETVLAEPHHLSYPFVFAAEGEVFMIPESASDGTVSLYRATRFPRDWRREAVLLDGEPATDATVARGADGRWWMFVGTGSHSRQQELSIYWADRIRGPWQPHALNPVKLDARSSRPAGALFRRDGKWIRPAQDCSRVYGGGMSLNEIVRLTPDEFEERPIERLVPPWTGENLGMHTLAQGERLEMIDGRVRGTPTCRYPFLAALERH